MRSATSYFNVTLFRKNLSRFWPIWGLYGFLWLMLLPVNVLVTGEYMDQATTRLLPLNFLAGAFSTAAALSFLFGILTAMAVFSYLYSSRPVGFLHALPMRREGLFLTNYLSGLAFLIVPNVVVFLLSLVVEAAFGILVFSSLFTWLVVVSMLNLFFYSFAVFCGMFTGHILALPAFYGILNILAAGLCYLMQNMASRFLFGFTGATWMEDIAIWLTPIALLGYHTGIEYGGAGTNSPYFTGLGYVFLLALVGVVFAALALVAYRRRQLESAGDVVSVSWVKPVFQYGVAFCCAITLGSLFDNIFSSLLPRSAWVLLVWMLIWGAFGCFVAAMLLRKSFWVFKPCWKGCAVFLAVLAAAMFLMELDGFGFERQVPDAAQVKNVYVSEVRSYPDDDLRWNTYKLEDPDLIQQVVDLHRRITEEKGTLENANVWTSSWSTQEDGVDVETEGGTDLRLIYTLTDGSIMERYYYLPVTTETLADPNSPDAMLQALLNTPGLSERDYFASVSEGDRLVDAVLAEVKQADGSYSPQYLPAEALTELEEAIHADLAAGNLGRRYLLEDRERLENCCYCDLVLTYRIADSGQTAPTEKVPVTEGPAATATQSNTYSITITLQKSAVNTMAVLEKYGIEADTMLPSLAEYRFMEN